GCIGADGGSGLAGSVQRSQKSEGFDWLWPVSSGGGTVITSETVFTNDVHRWHRGMLREEKQYFSVVADVIVGIAVGIAEDAYQNAIVGQL
ncbi:MAG: hypothetical protein WAK33_00100, partial [Silvibacterium sp.]